MTLATNIIIIDIIFGVKRNILNVTCSKYLITVDIINGHIKKLTNETFVKGTSLCVY